MHTLNLGILAHVDAGKTSLTERLLHTAGAIDALGSVDDGSTRTDSLALERRRGITIKSAVVSFTLGATTVNLIDTPGHPDFIAEVERVLGVLDGAVLVVSAVEGVQAQTRVLLRTLRRLRIPTLLFVNKTDRPGARYGSLLTSITERLSPDIVEMGSARGLGTHGATSTPFTGADPGFTGALTDLLTRHDDELLSAYVDDPGGPHPHPAPRGAGRTDRPVPRPPGLLRLRRHRRGHRRPGRRRHRTAARRHGGSGGAGPRHRVQGRPDRERRADGVRPHGRGRRAHP